MRRAIDQFPEFFRFRGVGTEREGRLTVRNNDADGRDNVIDRNGENAEMRDPKLYARVEGDIFHDVALLVTEFGKTRVDRPIKDIALKQVNDLLRGMNANWFFEHAEKVVDEDRQTRNMIHVRVRDNDVTYDAALRIREGDGDTSGVNGHTVIDEETCQPLLRGRAAMIVERAW